jgi:hypothetical protein
MVAKRSGSLSETQDALGHRHASTTRIYVESIAVKTDKYSQHILEALELPDFEIDCSLDPGSDKASGSAVNGTGYLISVFHGLPSICRLTH